MSIHVLLSLLLLPPLLRHEAGLERRREDEHKGDSDYEETVPVDWLKAGAIETTQSPLVSFGKGEFCILYTRVTFSFYHARLIQG